MQGHAEEIQLNGFAEIDRRNIDGSSGQGPSDRTDLGNIAIVGHSLDLTGRLGISSHH
jgi:hypothetical protein